MKNVEIGKNEDEFLPASGEAMKITKGITYENVHTG